MVLRRRVGPAMIDVFDLRELFSPSLCGDGVSLDWWCARVQLVFDFCCRVRASDSRHQGSCSILSQRITAAE